MLNLRGIELSSVTLVERNGRRRSKRIGGDYSRPVSVRLSDDRDAWSARAVRAPSGSGPPTSMAQTRTLAYTQTLPLIHLLACWLVCHAEVCGGPKQGFREAVPLRDLRFSASGHVAAGRDLGHDAPAAPSSSALSGRSNLRGYNAHNIARGRMPGWRSGFDQRGPIRHGCGRVSRRSPGPPA